MKPATKKPVPILIKVTAFAVYNLKSGTSSSTRATATGTYTGEQPVSLTPGMISALAFLLLKPNIEVYGQTLTYTVDAFF